MARRGDLGFLQNSNNRAPNRSFFGGPGHPSKKGITAVSQTSRINIDNNDTPHVQPIFQNDMATTPTPNNLKDMSSAIISKRTEYLETQERRITATINETRGDTLALKDKVSQLESKQASETNALYQEMQQVYGKVPKRKLQYVDDSENIEEKKLDKVWQCFVYPMKTMNLSEDHQVSLMKIKNVDKYTGELSLDWVIVYEKNGKQEIRHVEEFAMSPV